MKEDDPKCFRDKSFGFWCGRIALTFKGAIETHTREVGLTGPEAHLITMLDCHGPSTLAEIARRLHFAHPSVLRHLDALERAGFVERTPHPRDRRAKVLNLTDKGRGAVPVIREAISLVEKRAAAGFKPFQAEALEILIAWGEKRTEAMELIEIASQKHPDISSAEELVPLVYRLKQGIEV